MFSFFNVISSCFLLVDNLSHELKFLYFNNAINFQSTKNKKCCISTRRFTSDTVNGMIANLYSADITTYSSFTQFSPRFEATTSQYLQHHRAGQHVPRHQALALVPRLRFVHCKADGCLVTLVTSVLMEDKDANPLI